MPRPLLPKFDLDKFAAVVERTLKAIDDKAKSDMILSALLPSPELHVNRDNDFVYQGRPIASASATYKVVARALLVEFNNRTTQIERMVHAMSRLRCVPRPTEALNNLNTLLDVYAHIKQYLITVITVKPDLNGE